VQSRSNFSVLCRVYVVSFLGHDIVLPFQNPRHVQLRITLCLISITTDRSKDGLKTPTIGAFGSGPTNKKIVWFDITIDKVLVVDCLYARDLRKEIYMNISSKTSWQSLGGTAPSAEQPCILS
jgi:hypothetical protein